MKNIEGGLSSVPGFLFSSVECGIRYTDRLDYCMIFSADPLSSSGMFTTNKVFAAPVKLCRERIDKEVHGILINATNANACTGDEGFNNAVKLTAEASRLLGVQSDSFLMASTGIIGRQLPVEKMLKSTELLTSSLSNEAGKTIPRAIMTTDTCPKECAREFTTSKGIFRIAGTAKGSGMIAPNMATMLAFIITDAPVAKKDQDRIFRSVVEKTFNAITIDGDMSTNDTSLLLSPKRNETLSAEDLEVFEAALFDICHTLSYMLVKDAEGGTKCVTVTVKGADNASDAKKIAKSISESLLVKTAFFGSDPNWGRIACAAGYAGVPFVQENLEISIDDIRLLSQGQPVAIDKERLSTIMKNNEYTVYVSIGEKSGEFSFMTSDISYEYVKINGEYTT